MVPVSHHYVHRKLHHATHEAGIAAQVRTLFGLPAPIKQCSLIHMNAGPSTLRCYAKHISQVHIALLVDLFFAEIGREMNRTKTTGFWSHRASIDTNSQCLFLTSETNNVMKSWS